MALHLNPRKLLIFLAVVMLALWLLPCVVVFLPQIYFDVDPRSASAWIPITTLGPAGAAVLQTLGLFVAAAAMTLHLKVGGRVHWLSVALIGAGMAVCGYHMTTSYANAAQGGAWLAASALALAAFHVSEHASVRRWMIAGLVAVLIPMALQAIWYIWVDYPATVAMFEKSEAAVLHAHGWAWHSPEHELYRRRLLSPDVIGTFGLSNVFGSMVAGLTLLCAALALGGMGGGWRSQGRVAAGAAGVASAMGAVTIALTHSKGAALAAMVGFALLGIGAWSVWKGRGLKYLSVIALLCVLSAPVAVGVRGWVGPPSPQVGIAGERSLLFRYQYWQSMLGILTSQGLSSVAWGVGPADFKSAYLVAKNPLNPEEVASAHNVGVDFVTTLGVGGLAWAVVLLIWLILAGRGLGTTLWEEEDEPCSQAWRRGLVILLTAVIFGTQYVYILPQLVTESALWWMFEAVSFAVVMNVMLGPHGIAAKWQRLGLWVGATVILMHNQIEMSFYHGPSSALAWAMVAVAAGSARQAMPRPQAWRVSYGVPLLLALAGLGCVVGYAQPMIAHEHRLAQASADLQREIPRPYRAIQNLAAAAAIYPSDKTALRWRVRLLIEIAMIARQQHRQDIAASSLGEAQHAINQAQAGGGDLVLTYRLRAQVDEVTGGADWRQHAIQAMSQVVAHNPYSLHDLVRLAELYHEQGEAQMADEFARRALDVSEKSYLDPAKQLDAATHDRVALWLLNSAS